jgi:hypothetical protein
VARKDRRWVISLIGLNCSMACIDRGLTKTKRDDVEAFARSSGNFHARRPHRHTSYGQALDALGAGSENPPHVRNRNMPLERKAVDEGGVARGKTWGQTNLPLQSRATAVVNDLGFAPESGANLPRPLFAAPAARITVHHDVAGERRG